MEVHVKEEAVQEDEQQEITVDELADQEKSRRRWIDPDPPSSFRHALMHLPAHPDCDICKYAKITHAPARRQKHFVRTDVFLIWKMEVENSDVFLDSKVIENILQLA